jgi:16S rRNA (uracil1498-N3)-methyltransferase
LLQLFANLELKTEYGGPNTDNSGLKASKKMHRFYIPPARWVAMTLENGEAHHCVDVLRLDQRSKVVLFDGRGTETTAEIVTIEKGRVRLRSLSSSKTERLRCAVTLAQAVPKGKKMDIIVQKATELGVSRIVPLLSERTVVQVEQENAPKKREKWEQIAIEAAKQCGQNWLPDIVEPTTPKRFLADMGKYEVSLIASLQNDARGFKQIFADFYEQHRKRPVSALILIGPEGDFTPAEASLAKSAGCIPITLGPIVLRSETAAIFCLSVLAYELQ